MDEKGRLLLEIGDFLGFCDLNGVEAMQTEQAHSNDLTVCILYIGLCFMISSESSYSSTESSQIYLHNSESGFT